MANKLEKEALKDVNGGEKKAAGYYVRYFGNFPSEGGTVDMTIGPSPYRDALIQDAQKALDALFKKNLSTREAAYEFYYTDKWNPYKKHGGMTVYNPY